MEIPSTVDGVWEVAGSRMSIPAKYPYLFQKESFDSTLSSVPIAQHAVLATPCICSDFRWYYSK